LSAVCDLLSQDSDRLARDHQPLDSNFSNLRKVSALHFLLLEVGLGVQPLSVSCHRGVAVGPELVCSSVDDREGELVSVKIQRLVVVELCDLARDQLEVAPEVRLTHELSALKRQLVRVAVVLVLEAYRAVMSFAPLLAVVVLCVVTLLSLGLNPLVHLYDPLDLDRLVHLHTTEHVIY